MRYFYENGLCSARLQGRQGQEEAIMGSLDAAHWESSTDSLLGSLTAVVSSSSS